MTKNLRVHASYRSNLKSAYRKTGGHFFDRDTMEHFNSRLLHPVYRIGDERFFVTSERDPYREVDKERGVFVDRLKLPKYTVRHWDGKSVNVDTVGNRFEDAQDALTAANHAAHDRARALFAELRHDVV